MSNETITFLKNMIEQRKIKNKQLCALQTKEAEETEKEAKLRKVLEQAKSDQEICLRANLAGNASDQQLKDARDNVAMLTESIREVDGTREMLGRLKLEVTHEVSSTNGAIAAHRAMLCRELMEKPCADIKNNSKLRESLLTGYALFIKTGDYNVSWERFVSINFPLPSESEVDLATKKLKASDTILNESL